MSEHVILNSEYLVSGGKGEEHAQIAVYNLDLKKSS